MVYIIVGILIVLDIATGLIKAFKEKSYTSSIMREGLFHKCGSVALIVLGIVADYAQTLVDIGVKAPVSNAICVYIILMEIGSIIENIGKINPKLVPSIIKPYFTKLTNQGEN